MSTLSLSYSEVIRVRRVPAVGRILILSAFILVAITILVMAISANANVNDQAAVSQNSIVPIPVPTPPITEIQSVPSETPSPSSGLASEPSVVPVPVPTPLSQSEWQAAGW